MKLQISDGYKSFGAFDILEGAGLQVKASEKIGLVGRNGAGKTTLLKIMAGEEDLDRGQVIVPKDIRVGTLSQITFGDLGKTVHEALLEVFEPLKQLERQMEDLTQVLESDPSQSNLEKFDRLQTEYQAKGGYEYEKELQTVFHHFGFAPEELEKRLSEFSSGQRTRIGLVKLLLSKPDVLLLDEPTNHLDIDSIEWLEGYVKRYPGAVVIVSHDRMFLDHVVDEIAEIEFGKVRVWPGSYTQFVKAKEDWLQKNHEAYMRQQEQIRNMEALIEKFRYKKNKAAFAQSKIKQLDRMEKIEDSRSDRSRMKARFTAGRPGGRRVLETEHLKAGYDSVLADATLTLMKGERLGIVGPNGTGKSTFMKTIAGRLAPLSGTFRWGHQIDLGYFDQDTAQDTGTGTVIDELWDVAPDATQTEIRSTLASFLFTQDEVFKDVSDISGGERVRLALAKLMLAHDNVLLLDEPTNHLDIPAREALEDSLKDYDGTVIFVSHDRMFLDKSATKILEIRDGKTTLYDGSYAHYLEGAAAPVKEEVREEKKPEARVSFQDQKALKNRIRKLEELIAREEEKLETMRELRYEPEYYQDYRKMEELDAQIDDQHNVIAGLYREWEEKLALAEEAEE